MSIYLKTAVVIPSGGKGEKAAVIHPPIDRILLTAIAANYKDAELLSKPWTRLNETDYQIIRQKILTHMGHFNWQTEAYWSVSDDESGTDDLKSLKKVAE